MKIKGSIAQEVDITDHQARYIAKKYIAMLLGYEYSPNTVNKLSIVDGDLCKYSDYFRTDDVIRKGTYYDNELIKAYKILDHYRIDEYNSKTGSLDKQESKR